MKKPTKCLKTEDQRRIGVLENQVKRLLRLVNEDAGLLANLRDRLAKVEHAVDILEKANHEEATPEEEDDTDAGEYDDKQGWVIRVREYDDHDDSDYRDNYFVGLLLRLDSTKPRWSGDPKDAEVFFDKDEPNQIMTRKSIRTAFYAGQGECWKPELVRVICGYNPKTGEHDKIRLAPDPGSKSKKKRK